MSREPTAEDELAVLQRALARHRGQGEIITLPIGVERLREILDVLNVAQDEVRKVTGITLAIPAEPTSLTYGDVFARCAAWLLENASGPANDPLERSAGVPAVDCGRIYDRDGLIIADRWGVFEEPDGKRPRQSGGSDGAEHPGRGGDRPDSENLSAANEGEDHVVP